MPTRDVAETRLAASWFVNATFVWDYRIADPNDYGDFRYAEETLEALVGIGLGAGVAAAMLLTGILIWGCARCVSKRFAGTRRLATPQTLRHVQLQEVTRVE